MPPLLPSPDDDPLGNSLTGRTVGPVAARPPGGGALGSYGDIFPPPYSTIPPGKQVGQWTNPATTIDPRELAAAGGGMPGLLNLLKGGGNPLLKAFILAMQSTPTASNDTLPYVPPPQPSTPNVVTPPTGGPGMSQPTPPMPNVVTPATGGPGMSLPSTPTITPPIRPAATPAAATPAINPATANLGYYRAGVGNARSPVFVPQGQTTAPPIYRGPMTTGGNRTPYYG